VRVPKENIHQFLEATKINAINTRREKGNLRLEIHQGTDDPRVFFFLEAYKDEDAVKAHKEAEYYKTWRKIAEPLMTGSLKTTNCKIIFRDQL
jgi:quinol monooxygenase YgiN